VSAGEQKNEETDWLGLKRTESHSQRDKLLNFLNRVQTAGYRIVELLNRRKW
jgi:hypothetical protein